MVVIGSGQLSDMIKAGGGKCVGQMSQNTTHLVATASDWESKSAKGRDSCDILKSFVCNLGVFAS